MWLNLELKNLQCDTNRGVAKSAGRTEVKRTKGEELLVSGNWSVNPWKILSKETSKEFRILWKRNFNDHHGQKGSNVKHYVRSLKCSGWNHESLFRVLLKNNGEYQQHAGSWRGGGGRVVEDVSTIGEVLRSMTPKFNLWFVQLKNQRILIIFQLMNCKVPCWSWAKIDSTGQRGARFEGLY